MERLLTADNVAEILQVSKRSAYSYMRDMPHLDRPLRVSETSLREWINARTMAPAARQSTRPKGKHTSMETYRIPRRK